MPPLDHEDTDSLFGSPPPEPTTGPSASRGRSPSPLLALPSGSGTCSSSFPSQNVGTIALPGSHPYSELPVNPLALSSSNGLAPISRPPAQVPPSVPPAPDVAAWTPQRTTKSKKNKSRSIATSRSSTPRAPPPQIPLPDPDEPIPRNFLRNQQALLGLAGLVGGVNPARLAHKPRPSGSTSLNPIVIEDASESRESVATELPTSSPDDAMVASLLRRKTIFPVLTSILKFITDGDAGISSDNPADPAQVDQRGGEPLLKKRKLGPGIMASDPSSSDSAPPAQSAVAQRAQAKQLVAQLVELVKTVEKNTAARFNSKPKKKAKRPPKSSPATEPKICGHYRPKTLTYGLDGCQVPLPVPIPMPMLQIPPTPSNTTPPMTQLEEADLQQFLAALAATPTEGQSSSLHDFGSSPQSFVDPNLALDAETPSEMTTPDLSEDFFDQWLSAAFPSPDTPGVPIDPSSSFTFPDAAMDVDVVNNVEPRTPLIAPTTTYAGATYPDVAIDPVLLALSAAQTAQPHVPVVSETSFPDRGTFSSPAVRPQPQGVRIQFGGVDFTVEDPVAGASMLMQLANANSTQSTTADSSQSITTNRSQSTSTNRSQSTTTPSQSTTTNRSQPKIRRHVAGPGRPPTKLPSEKDDVMQRARERSRHLAAEIERAKVELWETVIEHGALAQLGKELVGREKEGAR